MRARALLLAALALVAARPPHHPAPAPIDWTRTVVATGDGGFAEGNPHAKVVLVEYLSLACPHCAAFAKEGLAPLADRYIRPGLVRYEVRTAFTSPFDLPATLLARCGGPAGFFRVLPAVYAEQARWEEQGVTWAQTTRPDLEHMKPAEAMAAIARGAGLDALFRAHGLGDARQAACLADEAEARRLTQASDAAWAQPGFPGTPAFAINGALVPDIHGWAALDARLAAATK